MIGHLHQTGKIKKEYVSYQKNGMTVSSVLKKFSVVTVDQDMIPNFKLHLQLLLKKIIENKTTSITKSQYQNMICEGREVSVSTVQTIWFAASSASLKQNQKTPQFDASKAYQDALPVN